MKCSLTIYYLLFLAFCGCNNKEVENKKCILYYYTDINSMGGNLLIKEEFDSTNYLSDIGENNKQGVYRFYKNNTLRDYTFFEEKGHFSYYENYKINGELDSILGTPIFWMPFSDVGKDSLELGIDIFDFNKTIIDFKIKINDSILNNLVIKEDSIFSNMKRFDIRFKTNNSKTIKIFFECRLKFCNNNEKVFLDSIYFHQMDTIS